MESTFFSTGAFDIQGQESFLAQQYVTVEDVGQEVDIEEDIFLQEGETSCSENYEDSAELSCSSQDSTVVELSPVKLKKSKGTNFCVLCKKENSTGVVLHSFPKSEPLRSVWLKLCGVEKLLGYQRLCSDHFSKKQYEDEKKFPRRLVKYAVPSIGLPQDINNIPVDLLESMTLSWPEDSIEKHHIYKQVLIARLRDDIVAHQIQGLCRLCFKKSEISPEALDASSRHLAWKLLQIKISVTPDSTKTPQSICGSCLASLQAFNEFHDKCRRNQENLKTIRIEMYDTLSEEDAAQAQEAAAMAKETFFATQSILNTSLPQLLLAEDDVDVPVTGQEEQLNLNCTFQLLQYQKPSSTDSSRSLINPKRSRNSSPAMSSPTPSPVMGKTTKTLKMYQCSVCPKKFLLEKSLRDHSENMHLNVIECDICKQSIPWKDFPQHEVTCGQPPPPPPEPKPQSEPVECHKCGMRLANKIRLRVHDRHVHGVKRFKCDICDFSTAKELLLKEHQSIHEGVKMYKCEFCFREFRNSSNYYTHRHYKHPVEYTRLVEEKQRQKREKMLQDLQETL